MDGPGLKGTPARWSRLSRSRRWDGDGGLAALRQSVWTQGLVAMLRGSIPYTKAVPCSQLPSLVLRDDRAASAPPRAIDESGDAKGYAGYPTLCRHLVQIDAGTRWQVQRRLSRQPDRRPLSPRDVVLQLREDANDATGAAGIGGVLGSLMNGGGGALDVEVVGLDHVREETIWACMQCNACVEACPVGIEQAPMINQMRRHLVEEGRIEPALRKTLQGIRKSGNSLGENGRKRGRWTRELPFEVKDARTEAVDVLWFVGDYASFDPRSQRVTRSIAMLLRAGGVDFGILSRGSATPQRRRGPRRLFEMLPSRTRGHRRLRISSGS